MTMQEFESGFEEYGDAGRVPYSKVSFEGEHFKREGNHNPEWYWYKQAWLPIPIKDDGLKQELELEYQENVQHG